jgi:hypothetical protein
MSLRSVAFVALLGSLIGSLAACSGKDELSFEDWQSQVSDVCDEYEPKYDATDAKHGEPADLPAFEALLVDYIAINEEYIGAVIVVGVPSERADEVEALYAGLEAIEDVANELLAAVRSGDMAASEVLSDDSAERTEYLNAQAQEMGVPACDSRAREGQET